MGETQQRVASVFGAVLTTTVLLSVCIPPAAAGEEAQPSLGERAGYHEFQRSCAACHGEGARGDGPVAAALDPKPSDLTLLSRNNGGEFPFEHTFATIDGRDEVQAHGPRVMPVWGDRFQVTESGISEPGGEYVVLGRTLGLVLYLKSIQAE